MTEPCRILRPTRMAALGQGPLWPAGGWHSRSTPVSEMPGAFWHLRFVPSADLLNHLVGDSPDQTRLLMFSVAD
jgi:hypothetical protein